MPCQKMIAALKKRYPQAAVLASTAVASGQTWALSTAQNTQITDGYSAVEITVAAIIAGLLAVVLGVAGWSIIKGLLRS